MRLIQVLTDSLPSARKVITREMSTKSIPTSIVRVCRDIKFPKYYVSGRRIKRGEGEDSYNLFH